jgi:uncharacterized protein involved in exopolysaccharide biosynthesis
MLTIHKENQEELNLIIELRQEHENNVHKCTEIMKKAASNKEGLHHIDKSIAELRKKLDEDNERNLTEENIEALKDLFIQRINEIQSQIII